MRAWTEDDPSVRLLRLCSAGSAQTAATPSLTPPELERAAPGFGRIAVAHDTVPSSVAPAISSIE
jgi:hypothetical protein